MFRNFILTVFCFFADRILAGPAPTIHVPATPTIIDQGEDFIVWPDGTWCFRDELEEFLSPPCAHSDDYTVLHFDSLDWHDFNRVTLGPENDIGYYIDCTYCGDNGCDMCDPGVNS